MSENVVRLDINELLDELVEENNRLSNELHIANKCLRIFQKYRNYLTKFNVNCKCDQNNELKSDLNSLENEYKTIIKTNDLLMICTENAKTDEHENEVKIICVNNNNYGKNRAINSTDNNVMYKSVSNFDNEPNIVSDNTDNTSVSRINFIRNHRKTDKKVINGLKFVKPNKNRSITLISDSNIELKNMSTINSINSCVDVDMNDYNDNSHYVVSSSDQFSDQFLNHYKHEINSTHVIDHNLNNEQQLQQQNDDNFDNKTLKAIEFMDSFGNRRFGCPYPNCNTDYAGVHRVRSHMYSVHTNHRPFKCSQCQKGFTRSDYLGEHINSVHSTTIFSCDWNGCTFETKNHKRLNKHKLRHTGNEQFRCDDQLCTKRYYSKTALERHTNSHKPFAPKLYDCDWPECGLTFSTPHELKCHTRGRHVVRELRVCEWPGCESKFKTTGALNVHVSSRHTGEKPFKCDWPGCEFAFINRSAMRKHIIVHSEEKKFECNWPECEKKFRTAYSLKIHLRVHCGERPFKCLWPQCGRSYTINSKLKRHYKTHTNIE